MDYVMNAEGGKIGIVGRDIGSTAEQRIRDCEKEIAATLLKYNCILIVQVAAKEEI